MLIKQRLGALFCAAATALGSVPSAFAVDSSLPDLNLPSLGTVAGADLSLLQERALGEQLMRRVRSDSSFMSDPEITDYLNRLGYRLVAAGASQPYNFFFFPIRDQTLNAFALPGGFIAVHTGLIAAAQSESELAGVIGHEVGHVTQRHVARMLEQNNGSLAMTIGSLLLALLAARAGGSSGGDAAMAIAMGTQAALIQQQLAYSRDAEREADRVGLTSLANAGFDPRGMQNFFTRLQQNNRYYESASLAYLSTHPMTAERMSDMQGRTRLMPARHHSDSLDFLLVQARARVLQQTTFDGWLKVSKYFDEALKGAFGERAAALHYGLSVAYLKMNRNAMALAEAQQARSLIRGKTSVILDKNIAQLLFENAKTETEKKEALSIAKKTAEHYAYSAMAAENYAALLHRAGQDNEVIRFLRNQRAIGKSDPDYYVLLARSYEALGQKSLAYAATGDMYVLAGNAKAAVYQFDLAQKANDADFYAMSEIDAKLRAQRQKVLDEKKDK